MPHKFITAFSLIFLLSFNLIAQDKSIKIGVIGLTHSHVHQILSREDIGDIEIVGIVEPDKDLAQRYSKIYKYPLSMVFNTIEDMIQAKKPEAVTAFNSIYGHLEVVEVCAPLGIHVMVEKPLAVSLKHAKKNGSTC